MYQTSEAEKRIVRVYTDYNYTLRESEGSVRVGKFNKPFKVVLRLFNIMVGAVHVAPVRSERKKVK